MTVTGSARFHRRNVAPPPGKTDKPKRGSSCFPILLSCCLFLAIVCACLLSALVLIGRHLYHNTDHADSREETTVNPRKQPFVARLPNDTFPLHYDLTLRPDVEKGDFRGEVNITVRLTRRRRNVLVHSKNLSIDEADLYYTNGSKAIEVQNVEENAVAEVISVVPKEELPPGIYYLSFKFSGGLLNKTKGFYRSQYMNQTTNETRPIATSKFEPTYARQAFPCFDEPNMKAKYTVHILKPKDDSSYIALSNMPQEEKEDEEENGIMVHFKESVKMSTYLTCFIVCDFEFKNTVINPETDNVPLRVYATPAQLEKTEYAVDVARKVIEYFLQYFNIKYPLPKLDLIAIPDFVSGAMEHWGLVTFRETALLYDKDKSSTANKQRIATVISHELAHSWFGNLVTMNWWSDLWLNEGFASYIEYKGVDAVHGDWQMLDQFIIEDLHPVLSLDATPASHPIVKTVVTPDQITEVFDTITYNKGASILRMLEGAVGEKVFQDGVTAYLNANAWGNAETKDLLDELQKIVGSSIDVTDFMDTWTVQMGYPVLTITEGKDEYIITQNRFLKDPDQPGNVESSYGYKWTIPITYITDKNQDKPETAWFYHNEDSITLKKPTDIAWIKFNHKQVGYYRVNYSKEMWKLLAAKIGDMVSISDKTHLLEESFSLAESGADLLDYDVPLDLTKYLKEETNYIPWSVGSTKLEQLRKYLIGSLEYSKYLDYIVSIVKPAYEVLTWTESADDDHLKRRARITILSLACSVGLPECLTEARERFQKWLNDPVANPLSQDLRSIVYKYGMEEAGKTEWEKLLEVFKEEIDANEKLNLMRGLAAVKELWLLRRLIELGKDETIIRGQDYFTMLQYVSANPVGTLMVWDYVRESWDYLVGRFGLNDRYLGKLIPGITSRFTTKTKLKEMKDFFAENPEAGAGASAREEALANVNNNIKWIAKNKEKVEQWIRDNAVPSQPLK